MEVGQDGSRKGGREPDRVLGVWWKIPKGCGDDIGIDRPRRCLMTVDLIWMQGQSIRVGDGQTSGCKRLRSPRTDCPGEYELLRRLVAFPNGESRVVPQTHLPKERDRLMSSQIQSFVPDIAVVGVDCDPGQSVTHLERRVTQQVYPSIPCRSVIRCLRSFPLYHSGHPKCLPG